MKKPLTNLLLTLERDSNGRSGSSQGQGPPAGGVRRHIWLLVRVETKQGYQWIELIEFSQESQKVAVESQTVNFGDVCEYALHK